MDIFNRINMRGNRIENCPDLDITQKEIAFQEAEKRENIKSNEKVPVIFGKISRWFTDLGSHLEDKFIHVTENEREKWDKATQVSFSQNLTTGTRVGTISIDGKEYDLYCETNTDTNTDTKNTAGSTNSNSKLFLVGAAAQTENSKTYSRDSAYISTDGCLYSNNAKTLTVGDISQSEAVTLAGRKVLDAVEKNAAVPGTLAHQVQQVNSNISEQIYDFETSTFLNNITYVTRLSEWYPKNKIYKIGRICWMSLGIKTKNVTENDKVLNVAAIPDAFAPIAVVSKRSSDYTVGIYPGNNLLYASERDVTKFPNWSDVAGEGKEEFIEFNFVYFSKI